MGLDITPVLENWPFRYDEVSARRILGDDGTVKIQLRLDMGLLQMEVDGRPDGRRPHGYESYLDYHLSRLEAYKQKKDTDEGFMLTEQECEDLRREAAQYYHRYLAFSALNDYERLVRDTGRNLRLLDFMWRYAPESERWSLEQFRPYLILMNTRGKVLMSLEAQDYTAALLQIRSGILALEEFYRKHKREDALEQSQEIATLRKWADEIAQKRPPTIKAQLEKELAEAVRNENYERAARIRDQIRLWESINRL